MENKNLETSPKVINTEQQNQQPNQPLNHVSPDEARREKNKRIKIALLALAAVVLVGGILLLKGMQSPLPVPAPSPQSQILDTAGWQTYRNDEFGFEVKYPPLWSENSSGDGATLGENRIDIGIIVWNDGSTEYVESQWKQIDCAPGNDPNGGCSPLYNKEEKKLSLNSYAVYFKIDGRGQMHAYIPNRAKNKTVEIYSVYLTDRKVFDQILSTFRFLR